ncbi:MAG: hypothetical protein PCFJNLEI_02489 [Verrucomicrobiae bacterium]|nr:hypothetical protein [Verrucomicrobiae bacterium]
MKTTLALLLAVSLSGHLRATETNSTSPVDVTSAVARGIQFFRDYATPQIGTNENSWLFHPLPGNFAQVIGWKTNDVRYKEITVTIPGYQYADPYEVLVPGASPTDPLVRQTHYRSVTRDPSKDRQETRLTPDPNGPITRPYFTPIFDKDSGERWPYGGLGNNGLAILALRHCGVKHDDPLVSTPAYNLLHIVNSFGIPDNTHDLAWLTAGFAVMPGSEFKELTEQFASKLLDGQITTGPGTGLWGPVCVNTAMGSALIKTLGKWADDKKALRLELNAELAKKTTGKPTTRAQRLEAELEALDTRLTDLQEKSSRITQNGLLLYNIFGHRSLGWDAWGRRTLNHQGERFNIELFPYIIQNQISADLQSTALALYALRIAFENGRLPLKTWRPETPRPVNTPAAPSSDFPPPREARDVIALAARALTAARPTDGQWPELNFHQPVTDYAWLKSITQVNPTEFPKLPQPVTLVSICNGTAALANIQIIQTGKAVPTPLESATCRPLFQDLQAGKLILTNFLSRLPYDALLQCTAPRTKTGKTVRTDFTDWNAMANWLIQQQTASGEWGRTKGQVFMPSTSLVALRQVLKEINDAEIKQLYDKPHLAPAFFFAGNRFRYNAAEAPYFTAAALLFLAEGLPAAPVADKSAPKK